MQRIIAYCEKYHIFEEGDGVILGLSGGTDSVCLLLALLELRAKWKIRILAVHVHHGIRGTEADRDAAFAGALCERHGVEYVEERADIPALARELHMTEEEAGRHVRYQCFHRLLVSRGYQKIAVAHHKNDQAETILFHMARGTGIDGLIGMKPVAGEIVRPLLGVSRREIEEILEARGETYCSDATNADTAYTRNYIRHEVVNRLEQVNGEAVSHIAALSERLLLMQDYLQENVEQAYLACSKATDHVYGVCDTDGEVTALAHKAEHSGKQVTLHLPQLLGLHPYMRGAVVRRAVMELADGLKDIEEVHIEAVLDLLQSQPGRRRELPYGIVVWRGANELYLERAICLGSEKACSVLCTIKHSLMIPGKIYSYQVTPEYVLTVSVLEATPDIIDKKRYTKYFDCGKIKDNLVLRTPEPDDYLVIDSAGHRKKLNRYFVDEKVPVYAREHQMVLADGHHVLWVPGHRISEAYKVTEQTDTVVRISLMEVVSDRGELQIEKGEADDRQN